MKAMMLWVYLICWRIRVIQLRSWTTIILLLALVQCLPPHDSLTPSQCHAVNGSWLHRNVRWQFESRRRGIRIIIWKILPLSCGEGSWRRRATVRSTDATADHLNGITCRRERITLEDLQIYVNNFHRTEVLSITGMFQ